jgi:outer membrane lipopolysaccharide assembly protein LptE/RlpB
MSATAEKIVVLAAACVLATQCGYHLRGTGTFLPPGIKTVSVPMFKNFSTRYDLDVTLTQGVIDEFVARGKVEVIDDAGSADAVLVGEISSFSVNPIGFSSQNTADRYMVMVVAKIVLRDLKDEKVIFSNPSYVYQEEYEVPPGTSYETWETEALGKIAQKFARSLISTLLEGF